MKKILAACAAASLVAACTDPYTGRTDYGRTAVLGVLVGGAGAVAAGALNDRPYGGYGYRRPITHLPPVAGYSGYGGYGYGGYRGW